MQEVIEMLSDVILLVQFDVTSILSQKGDTKGVLDVDSNRLKGVQFVHPGIFLFLYDSWACHV